MEEERGEKALKWGWRGIRLARDPFDIAVILLLCYAKHTVRTYAVCAAVVARNPDYSKMVAVVLVQSYSNADVGTVVSLAVHNGTSCAHLHVKGTTTVQQYIAVQ